MSLAPLLNASPVIQAHAFAALAAFVLGIGQLIGRKGKTAHRIFGFLWIALMLVVALSSFAIHTINQWQGYSLIHLLSLFTLFSLAGGLWAAHRHDVTTHRHTMTGLFIGALVIAGIFTLAPGRIMHAVVFGS